MYSRAATWEDVNNMVSLRCGEDLVWWAVETLGRWWLENTEWQMALRNCHLSDDDDDDGNGNLTGSGQDKRANARKGQEPVRPDQRGKDDDNQSEHDDTRALQ
jgi:hypothetical protein